MRLRPSEILYSQSSISNTFSEGDQIGDILDDICDGHLRKRNFPRIEVAKINKKWYTAGNRRLWVFRKLEALGKCGRIPVDVVDGIPRTKMTTKNGGTDVKVRGQPGGVWIKKLESDPSSSSDYYSSDDDFYDRFDKIKI